MGLPAGLLSIIITFYLYRYPAMLCAINSDIFIVSTAHLIKLQFSWQLIVLTINARLQAVCLCAELGMRRAPRSPLSELTTLLRQKATFCSWFHQITVDSRLGLDLVSLIKQRLFGHL